MYPRNILLKNLTGHVVLKEPTVPGQSVISSSLGYGHQFSNPVPDYPYSNLNGDITMSARAADLAAKRIDGF